MTAYGNLITIIAGMDSEEDLARLFDELFTERERRDLALRWQLLEELHQGSTQRDIAARHKISLCKITRGSRILKDESSMVRRLLSGKKQSVRIP
ncbi:hypothetical protein JCM14469_40600 [Desulfatiferula olefinivorans]